MTNNKTIAIVQPFYFPWKGYFDLIARVDEFLLFDDVQYPKRSWVNRNLIKGPDGIQRITIPVSTKGKFNQLILETEVCEKWADKHLKQILRCYKRAPFFNEFSGTLGDALRECDKMDRIVDINEHLIRIGCKALGLETKIGRTSAFGVAGAKTDRLLNICLATKADVYISGPTAKSYLEEDKFKKAGIQVNWMSYDGYKKYNQLYGEFVHEVSILDLIFNMGPEAREYLLSNSKAE